ncbi:pulmonary surfactant-associated protein A-like [Harpia harpyja]|uniref:pulmonary surfactant-associated protein A-like n=1 Tax=Harpia harpyja TaxID=202280 RepID=UPI0022B13053|nr:pulmonary surfactant-associated protein A-like [Harpia harpyja]
MLSPQLFHKILAVAFSLLLYCAQGSDLLVDSEMEGVICQIEHRISRLERVLHFLKMITASGRKIFATSEKKADFHTTLTKCKEAGGSIATPRNPDENDAILYFVKTFNTYAYLGIKECLIPSRFQSLGSTQLSYTNWHLNEPSGKGEEECVEMYTDGTWNDKSCNKNRLIVCQF